MGEAAGAAEEDQQLDLDQLAAAIGEDRRTHVPWDNTWQVVLPFYHVAV